MSDSFALALFLLSIVLLLRLVTGVLTGQAGSRSRTGLIGLGAGLTVQAIGHVIGLVTGHHAAQPVVQLAYLAVSVAAVPVGLGLAGPWPDPGADEAARSDRWAIALLALTAAISAVMILRIQVTWRPRHG